VTANSARIEAVGARPRLASIEEIIDDARNGRMFILVDDEDRENEGDLVVPAQMATPEAVNFMARYGRGLICLAMTRGRADALGLSMMSTKNEARHATAFTVSIEARQGVTTGISAADRARTIAVAIDFARGSDEIVTPGHVFPLVARDGGVLVRAGHTEAAVDVARLAGLNASGVICEIMNDDGSMARLEDLWEFAKLHGLKIGTIRELIAYRRRHDHNVERVAEMSFVSQFGGEWHAITYLNKAEDAEHVALVKGSIGTETPVMVRMHQHHLFADTLGELGQRSGMLSGSMREIAEHGSGVIVLINRRLPDAMRIFMNSRASDEGADMEVLRDYGIGAQILADLDVREMILLTNTHHTLVALSGYGLSIVSEKAIRCD
jgi:3,4-dihydroxy 2-butanone 4-phosphate synthase/GTP cyclohydrolase II